MVLQYFISRYTWFSTINFWTIKTNSNRRLTIQYVSVLVWGSPENSVNWKYPSILSSGAIFLTLQGVCSLIKVYSKLLNGASFVSSAEVFEGMTLLNSISCNLIKHIDHRLQLLRGRSVSYFCYGELIIEHGVKSNQHCYRSFLLIKHLLG